MIDYHRESLELAIAGEWEAAHDIVQRHDDALACQIHACLHRIEGDIANARYWYQRAGVEPSDCATDDELRKILDTLMQ